MARDKWLDPFIGDSFDLNGLYYIWCIDIISGPEPLLSMLFYGLIDDVDVEVHIVDLTLDQWRETIS